MFIKEWIKLKAYEAGFEIVGVASARDSTLDEAIARYQKWLDEGRGATMDYLRRHKELKQNPSKLLKDCRSVVVLGFMYGANPPVSDSTRARVSIYTRGADYHELMLAKLSLLARQMTETHGVQARPFVDSEPVLERYWGWRAGLGWIGKNSLLINRKLGSYFFIGGLLVDAELEADEPGTDHCGRCRKCIEACPTDAICENKSIDSNRCIGYHTIENKGPLPEDLIKNFGTWIAGCDICQEVCPWNDPVIEGSAFTNSNPTFDASLTELSKWSAADFKARMPGIAMGRMKYAGFIRNLVVAIKNSSLKDAEKTESLDRLEKHSEEIADSPRKQAFLEALKWARKT